MLRVNTMMGLGDAFAARPTIAALCRKFGGIAVCTPWPECFTDIVGIACFIRPLDVNIRCAQRNIKESNLFKKFEWMNFEQEIQLSYHLCPGCKSVPEQIAESAGVLGEVEWEDFFMEAPTNVSPLAVFRVPTIRTEYRNIARNPAPGLVAAAVDEIGGDWVHLNHYFNSPNAEEDSTLEETVPELNFVEACRGELSLPSMLDLIARARVVVTPVCYMAWAALAYQSPTLCVWGGFCSAETIFGPILGISDESFDTVDPERVCCCFDREHSCAKSIPVERVREAARVLK